MWWTPAGPRATSSPDITCPSGVFRIASITTFHPEPNSRWTSARTSSTVTAPLLEGLLLSFPFRILGFYADNGSEYINHRIAELLEKLRVERFTKSRARTSNDNALVEGKNAHIVRRWFGHDHIPQRFADDVNRFALGTLSPFLNFHRPCLFATEYRDANGRVRRKYLASDVMTPYARFRSLPAAQLHLKPGLDFAKLDTCWVVFASGFRYTVVRDSFPAMEELFCSFDPESLAAMEPVERERLPIRNKRKADGFLAGCRIVAGEGFGKFKGRLAEEDGLDVLEELPGIGPVTKRHLAKNIGLEDTAKPDVWLVRCADECGADSVAELVSFLSGTNPSFKAHQIDTILWRTLQGHPLPGVIRRSPEPVDVLDRTTRRACTPTLPRRVRAPPQPLGVGSDARSRPWSPPGGDPTLVSRPSGDRFRNGPRGASPPFGPPKEVTTQGGSVRAIRNPTLWMRLSVGYP